jgi:hypothetical protein
MKLIRLKTIVEGMALSFCSVAHSTEALLVNGSLEAADGRLRLPPSQTCE